MLLSKEELSQQVPCGRLISDSQARYRISASSTQITRRTGQAIEGRQRCCGLEARRRADPRTRLCSLSVLKSAMPASQKLTPADPSDLAAAIAFALRYQGRKR